MIDSDSVAETAAGLPADEVADADHHSFQPVVVDASDIRRSTDHSAHQQRIGAELADLGAKIAVFHERAEQYESIIRRMQTRIEELQSDQARTLLKPIINRLASLFTEAASAAERAADRGDVKAQKDFGYFADEIEEGLGMLDIESLDTKVNDEFDATKHAARGAVPTGDNDLDRKVAGVVRQGFTYVGAERVMLPTIVRVYRLDPNLVAAETIDTVVASAPEVAADEFIAEGAL